MAASSTAASSSPTAENRCDFIPNYHHVLNMKLTIHGLLDFLEVSENVTSLFMALEALWTWDLCRELNIMYSPLINSRLKGIIKKRSWSLVPSNMLERFSFTSIRNLSSVLPSCVKKTDVCDCIFINGERMTSVTFPIIMNRPTKLRFCFEHPSIKSCNLPGRCGFILQVVPGGSTFGKIRLCTKGEDYRHQKAAEFVVHFHEEIRAEKMHVFFCTGTFNGNQSDIILPISWLNSSYNMGQNGVPVGNSQLFTRKLGFQGSGYFTVMYEI